MKEPQVTVLVPVRNGERFIRDAIQSVQRQTFEGWRLVVSDNLSRDATREIVRNFCPDSRIRLLESDRDMSMVENFNKCLEFVETPYYLLLCHDDYLCAANAIEMGLAALESNPAVPAVYCDLLIVNQDGGRIMTRSYHRSGLVDADALARRSILQTRNVFGIPLLVRTAAASKTRYDESLALTIDLDFSIATSKGTSIYHLPEALIAYRFHGSNQTAALMPDLLPEMTTLAHKYGLQLRALDRARMRLYGVGTNLARRAFILYGKSKAARAVRSN